MHIPLPKDLTDNQDPFNATHAQGAGDTEQYFHEQQNFREQNPTRNQESDRIIRQFEQGSLNQHSIANYETSPLDLMARHKSPKRSKS